MLKVVVHVAPESAEKVRQAIGNANGGVVGEYTFCSFSVLGVGRFVPSNRANPSVGTVNELNEVEEERIEVTCGEFDAPAIVEAIKIAHPYEEPTIDIYQLYELNQR